MSGCSTASDRRGAEYAGTAGRPGLILAIALLGAGSAAAELELPEPLELSAVAALARENRDEIAAARARAAAARERPAIVHALESPMLSASVDHYPFDMMEESMSQGRYDRSFSIEQSFPLSGIRGHRRRAAEADALRLQAVADTTELAIELEAITAFLMLHEKRSMVLVADEQLALAQDLARAAAARYAAASGGQADLLRAEAEAARAGAEREALTAETGAAEAMLNAALGRSGGAPVPALVSSAREVPPPSSAAVLEAALRNRPELRGGAAELQRAGAELDVMRSMYRPMASVRVGHASTMAEGDGAMLMVGISLPIWGGSLRAGVREAAAMEVMARADLAAMRRMVEGEVTVARERVESSRVRFRALRDDVVPRVRMAVRSAIAAYESGQSDMVGVIESMRALWSVEADLVMADADLALAWAQLDRAAGGLDRLQ